MMKLVDPLERVRNIANFWMSDIPEKKSPEAILTYARTDVIELVTELEQLQRQNDKLKMQMKLGFK